MKKFLRSSWIFGIRVLPPTSTISCTSFLDILESFNTCSTGSIVFLNKSSQIFSNRALVIDELKSIPSYNVSISIAAVVDEDKVLFALSQAVLNLLNDFLFSLKSFLNFLLNSSAKYSTIRESKSSPPK